MEKCDTSTAKFQAEAGVVDVVCEDDEAVLASIRQLVTILPSNYEDNDSYVECNDDLNRLVPALGTYLKDSAIALKEISDDNFFMK